MKIENAEVYGFRRALYGMRNPMKSWALSAASRWVKCTTYTGACSLMATGTT